MAKRLEGTPKAHSFRMPGEFEEHSKTWMIWPERTDNWRESAKPAQETFVNVAVAISKFEEVIMCASKTEFNNARKMLPTNIKVIEMSNDDSWMRDVGPTFLVNDQGELRANDWVFNAWGGEVDGLYEDWDQDDLVALKVSEIENANTYRTDDFVLEGGSIHVDGEGTLIVTEACLLSEGRNPRMTKEQIEDKLKAHLNLEKIIWLKNGIFLDETNEHVDNIIHYCAPGVIALAWTDDENDPQYLFSKAAYNVLSNETDAKGRKFEIHKLHIPNTVLITKEESEGVDSVDGTLPREEGDRQAASYANFYIVNGGIVFPTFNDPVYDKKAEEVLKAIFPNREIVGVYAREVILGGGNIHCITQQQPKVKK